MNRALVCGDYVDIVAKFLSPMDIINVCEAYHLNWKRPVLHQRFKESVCRKIDDFFRDYFGERYSEFRSIMISSGTVVSGSFILQMILGETWKNSDIDMYLLAKGNEGSGTFHGIPTTKLEDFFYSDHNGDLYVERPTPRYDALFKERKKGKSYLEIGMQNIREYESRKPELFNYFQVITFSGEGEKIEFVKRMIQKHYDFSICKNGFYYDEDGCHIWLTNIRAIVEKKEVFRQGYSYRASLGRARKYIERGFVIVGRWTGLPIPSN